MFKKLKNKINKSCDLIFLSLSDCDGMCNFCDSTLKKVCERNKIKS
jgi:hypothetical protein